MKIFLILLILLTIEFIIENKLILILRRKNFGGELKIMHISDIHKSKKGRNNCRISDIAEREKPDLIFITGDLVSRTETDFTSAEILLEKLTETAPVYMVYGNHEQSLCDDGIMEFTEMLERTDVHLLLNEQKFIDIHNIRFFICGIQQKYST